MEGELDGFYLLGGVDDADGVFEKWRGIGVGVTVEAVVGYGKFVDAVYAEIAEFILLGDPTHHVPALVVFFEEVGQHLVVAGGGSVKGGVADLHFESVLDGPQEWGDVLESAETALRLEGDVVEEIFVFHRGARDDLGELGEVGQPEKLLDVELRLLGNAVASPGAVVDDVDAKLVPNVLKIALHRALGIFKTVFVQEVPHLRQARISVALEFIDDELVSVYGSVDG